MTNKKRLTRAEKAKQNRERLAELFPSLAAEGIIDEMSPSHVQETLQSSEKFEQEQIEQSLIDQAYTSEPDVTLTALTETGTAQRESFIQLAETLSLAREVGNGKDIFEQVEEGHVIWEGLRADVIEGHSGGIKGKMVEGPNFDR